MGEQKQRNCKRYPKRKRKSHSQLGPGLGLLQDGVQLGRLHDVALDLELAAHEQTLSVGLAADEGAEVLVGEGKDDYSLTRAVS